MLNENSIHYKLLYSFVLICCSCIWLNAQHVTVSGKVPAGTEPESISIHKPIHGYFNVFYADAHSELPVTQGKFFTRIVHDSPGFIRLQGKGMPKIYFYAQPGDSIFLEFANESSGETSIYYKGRNAPANNLIS